MRRLLFILMLLLVLVGSAAGGGLLYLNSRIGAGHLLTLVNETVLESAGMRLEWRGAKGTYLFNLKVIDPVLVNSRGDTMVSAGEMRIRFDPWSLLSGRVELGRLEADRPVVFIEAFGRNASDGEREAAGPDSSDASGEGGGLPDLKIANIVLRNGTVLMGAGGPVYALSGINLRSDLRSSPGGGLDLDVRRLRAELSGWGLTIDDMAGRVILNNGRLWLIGARGMTEGGRFSFNGSLGLGDESPGDIWIRLDLDHLSEWWPLLGGEWPGNGPVHIAGRVRDRPWAPGFELTGTGNLAGMDLSRFQVRGRYDGAILSADVTGRGPVVDSLFARIELRTSDGAGRLEVRADSLRLSSAPVGIPVAIGNIRLSLSTSGYDPIGAGGTLQLLATGIRAYGVETDSLTARLRLGEQRIETLEPLLASGAGYRMSARGMLDTERDAVRLEISGEAAGSSQPLRLLGLKLEEGAFDLTLRATGRAGDPDLRGVIRARGLVQQGVRVADAEFALSVAQAFGARIGSFNVELDSLAIEPTVRLPQVFIDGRIQGDRITFQQIEGGWEGGGTGLQGEITVNAGEIEASLDRGYLRYREILLEDVRGQVSFRSGDGSGAFRLEARSGDGQLRLDGTRDGTRMMRVQGRLDRLDLGRFSRSLEWGSTPEGIVSGTFGGVIGQHVESLSLAATARAPRIAGHGYRSVEITASYDRGIVQIDRLRIIGEETESVELSGTVHLPGAVSEMAQGVLNIDARLADLRLEPFDSYLKGHRIRGELTGTVSARGTFAEPNLESRLSLNYAQLDTFQIESAQLDLDYDGARLRVANGLLSTMGFNARFGGSIPMALSFEPVRASIDTQEAITAFFEGRGQPTALLQPIGAQIEQVGGELEARLELQGTMAAPELTGNVVLSDGSLKPQALGQTIQDIQIDLTIEKSLVRINTFTGRLPSEINIRRNILTRLRNLVTKAPPTGDFSVTGSVELGDGGVPVYDLRIAGKGLGLSDPTGSLAVVVDPDLAFLSAPESEYPVLSGRIGVRQGLVDLGLITRLIGGEPTAQVGGEAGGGFRTDIDVDIPGRFRIVGAGITLDEDVNVEVRGDLILKRDPPGPFFVLGSLETVQGRGAVYAYGRRWSVDRGNITFGTIEEMNPNLDVQLSTIVQEVEVYLTLTGTALEPIARFSSDSPTLANQGDIMLFITLGMTPDSQAGLDVRERTTTFIESAVGRQAGEVIGLDTFEVRGLPGLTESEDTQISVGKYLGSQFYLRYSQYLGSFNQIGEFGVEYRLNRTFRISFTHDRFRRDFLELKWRIEY